MGSRNSERKQRYASLASEHDKGARNDAIDKALKEGADNVKGVEVVDEETNRKIHVNPGIIPTMPSTPMGASGKESRSAKRARLKTKRSKTLSPSKHRHLHACGNVGCKKCFPQYAVGR